MRPNTSSIARPEGAEEIAEQVREQRARIREACLAGAGGPDTAAALTRCVDAAISRAFRIACDGTGVDAATGRTEDGAQLAVLATGGYGRQELAPFSDVDVTFVASEEGNENLDTVVRRMFLLVMDIFTTGLRMQVGYAYRLPEDCLGLEHPTQTALLDARPVAGSIALAHRFQDELRRTLHPAVFVQHKLREREACWSRFGNSVFVSEPDLKEGPGGLRDIQVAAWIARARYNIRAADVWSELRGLGVLSDSEMQDLAAAHAFLLDVRHRLHYLADRGSDQLAPERQEALAEALGYRGGAQPPVREFMALYYRHAARVHALCLKVLAHCQTGPLVLDVRLVCRNNLIAATDRALLNEDPTAVGRIVRASQEYGFDLSPELREQINEFTQDSSSADSLRSLLPAVLEGQTGISRTVRLLVSLGVLERTLPEFERLMGMLALALIHRYTVGEHSLRVLEHVETFLQPEGPDGAELRRVFDEIERPSILYLAALLHDAGKAFPQGDHSANGAQVARAAAERLGLDARTVEDAAFLVRHHLLMSNTVQLRDVNQEATIRDFIAVVDQLDRLHMLYLLTIADMRATGTGVWTAVQSRFLEDLYYRAEQALSSGMAPVEDPEALARYRHRVRQELTLHNMGDPDAEEHIQRMPPAYLLNTPPGEIAAHVRAIAALKARGPAVEFRGERGKEFTVLTLCAFDDPQPGLLHKIAGVLYADDVEVHGAQVFTRTDERPIALDTLWIASHRQELPPLKCAELEKDLIAVLSGAEPVELLLKRRHKPLARHVELEELELLNDLSDSHTVVELRAGDQRGLLYHVTGAMAALGWSIHSARINTLGGEARDAFYVTGPDGKKVQDGKEALLAALR